MHARLFPKTRSWVALGTPLELLSPLSVLRVLYPLAALCWLAESLLLGWPRASLVWVVGATAGAGIVWLALLFVKDLRPSHCHELASLGTVLLMTSIWAGRGHATALALLPLFVPLEAFVALFLGARAVAWHQSMALGCLWLALVPTFGVVHAAGVAVLTSLAVLSSSAIIRVLIHAASRASRIDSDTGLPNGFGLQESIESQHPPRDLAVASVLLAGVAEAREALGYRVGIELIRRAAEDIRRVLPSGAVIARIDGDELVVAWAGGGHERGHAAGAAPGERAPEPIDVAGRGLVVRLATTVDSGHYLVGRVELTLRGHVGLAFAPAGGTRVAELARRASLSAHRAAAAGLATAEWDGDHGVLTMEDLSLLADLRLADRAGELCLVYQPKVDATSGRTVAVEALLRWRSAEHGEVPPGRFIVLAERTGLIDRLTEWVLRDALDTQRRWRDRGVEMPVAVNLSAKLLSRPDLAAWVLSELDTRALPAESLTIEVTETAAADLYEAVDKLRPLRERGVRVSIDDFGTGHTSLAALPYLPLDELKVDMAFVRRLTTSRADEAIVRSVSDLAHRLGLTAVAEGVETADVRDRLLAMGYDVLQGHFYAPALAEKELLAHLQGEAAATL